MALYKHKQTGDVITVNRLRIYIGKNGCSTYETDANNTNINLTRDYDKVVEEEEDTPKDFSGVRAKSAPKDGGKLR